MKHKARKSLGQNFLHDNNIILKIINCFNPQKQQNIVEIGAGKGALTQYLVKQVDKLTIVELDKYLVARLKQIYIDYNVDIYHQDILKFDFTQLPNKLRLIGNLPYNISTPLLFHTIKYIDNIEDMLFMLQKEVVDRICAEAGGRNYGRLSVMLQYYFQVEKLFNVKPTSFIPQPKVDSSIIYLKPHEKIPYLANDFNKFTELVRQAFAQKRKTLRNNLKLIMSADKILTLGINPQIRAENLTLEQFVLLSNNL
jgi:16S rRNA (adenine1518-N6/adenine1519-N6)-dimethyltransferase